MFTNYNYTFSTTINTLKSIIQTNIARLLFSEITLPTHCLESVNIPKLSNDSAKIFSQAMLDTKMVEYAYNVIAYDEKPSAKKTHLRDFFMEQLYPHGIIHYKTTYEILTQQENPHNLEGSIFLDVNKKIIVVALAGTRLESTAYNMLTDIWDDVRIACGFTTLKAEALMRLNDYIITEFQGYIKEGWSLHYTGHSSGAYGADLAANHMCALRDYLTVQDFQDTAKNRIPFSKDKISVTSFESVGGITPLKNAAAICGFKLTDENDVRLFEGDHCVFNSRKNFINSLDKQSNALIFIVEHEEHGPNKWWQFWKTHLEHRHDNFIKAFDGKGCIVGPDNKITTYDHSKIDIPTRSDHQRAQDDVEDILAQILSDALRVDGGALRAQLVNAALESAEYLVTSDVVAQDDDDTIGYGVDAIDLMHSYVIARQNTDSALDNDDE